MPELNIQLLNYCSAGEAHKIFFHKETYRKEARSKTQTFKKTEKANDAAQITTPTEQPGVVE